MKAKILHISFLCLTFLWALSVCSPIAYADTDGTEIQVVQPEQLEIQLGPAWTGVEFQLQTDAGLYPEPISVGEDGILRLEIGGSSRYVLSCLSSPVQPAPAAPEVGQPAEIIDAGNAIPQACGAGQRDSHQICYDPRRRYTGRNWSADRLEDR